MTSFGTTRPVIPIRRLFFSYLLLELLAVHTPEVGAVDMNSDLVNLMQGSSSIKYFKIGVPGRLFVVDGKSSDGWVYYEGSIQSNTFWIRNCLESIPSGPMRPGCTVGASFSENWYARSDGYTARSPKGHKIVEPTDSLATRAFKQVMPVLCLFAETTPDSMVVRPDGSFHCRVPPTGLIVTGDFELDSHGRPKKCVAKVDLGAHFSVAYSYPDEQAVAPSSFTVGSLEYRILKLKMGDIPLPSNGYTAEMALQETAPSYQPTNIYSYQGGLLFSNTGAYFRQADGALLRVDR